MENRIHEKPYCNGIPWDNVVLNCTVIGMHLNYLLYKYAIYFLMSLVLLILLDHILQYPLIQ